MKVLIINSVCGIRSTGRIVTDLAQSLDREGHDVRIAYGRFDPPERYKSSSFRICSKFENAFNALMCRFFDNDGFLSKRSTKRFIKWADSYNPDLVWLHNLHGYYINIPLLFNWIKSRPNMIVKWTLHDCWAFTGHCCYFTYNRCDKWKEGCSNCKYHHEYPSSLKDNSYRNFISKKELFSDIKNLTLIVPSVWLSKLVNQSFLKEYKTIVSRNKIDTKIFKKRASSFKEKYGLQNKKIVLGVASPWSKRKGLDDFLKLSTKLDSSFVVVLVGLSKKQIKELPANVLGLPKTNSPLELADAYNAADVFLNLTYEDNYPTTNLEAQACGTACITYNTGGSVESVSPNNVVEIGDFDTLVSLIKQITK